MRLPSPIRQFVHEPHAIDGAFRPPAAAVHGSLTTTALALERVLDGLAPRPAQEPLLDELTVVVKTFERPRVARRLVASIRRLYPALRIIVVDDSREPVRIQGAETVRMPYDSGIAGGRNEGLRHARTRYVLILDDDYVFYRRTRLAPTLTLMERFPEIDITGGQLVELPLFSVRPLAAVAGSLRPTDATPRHPLGSSIAGLTVVPKVPTFFVARRDRLAEVEWDARLKRIDHADFFTRAFGLLTTVFNPELRILHARTPFDRRYMSRRLDLDADRRLLAELYGSPPTSPRPAEADGLDQ
jgi:glycosyltransferase involved in cell wall biosynthesis